MSLTIDSPILAELFAYWDSKRGGRAMPSRADLDPIDIPRVLPFLILLEVEPETQRLRMRLTGTRVVEGYGRDYTGSYLDELNFGDQRETILDDYRACQESKRPSVAHRVFWNIRGVHFRFERLILPLSDDDRTVTMLVAGLDFQEVRGD